VINRIKHNRLTIIFTLGIFGALLWMHSLNFLLFHIVAEIFSTIIACCLFIISWNSRTISTNWFLSFLGIAFLFVGTLDFAHALAYKGMQLLQVNDANEATQLWVSARFMQALSLLIAPRFIDRTFSYHGVTAVFGTITVLLLGSIFVFPVFPICFSPDTGLTPFKKVLEYGISFILMLSIGYLFLQRKKLPETTYHLLIGAAVITVLSEIMFTLYVGVDDISNQVGHLLKILAFILIYLAMVQTTLKDPMQNLFYRLKKNRDEQVQLVTELQNALSQVRQLERFLPICSNCKQIRDDKGDWTQIESYISEHSDTHFSHSICPECAKKLYPDYMDTMYADAQQQNNLKD
jgi:hypothetical protein